MPKTMDYTPLSPQKTNYTPDDAYMTPWGREPRRTVPAAPRRGEGRDQATINQFTSKRSLWKANSSNSADPQAHPQDLFEQDRVNPEFATAADLARRGRRMSLTKPDDSRAFAPNAPTIQQLEQRTRAMQFLAGDQSTKAARRNVEDDGRVVMSVNEDSTVRLAHHGSALHLTYSSLVGHGRHPPHQRLKTILSVSLPVVHQTDISATVQQIYKMMTAAINSLTDRNVEDFGGHAIHMSLDSDLHEALKPGVSTALGAVSNAAATSMATRMNRAVRA